MTGRMKGVTFGDVSTFRTIPERLTPGRKNPRAEDTDPGSPAVPPPPSNAHRPQFSIFLLGSVTVVRYQEHRHATNLASNIALSVEPTGFYLMEGDINTS